MHSVLPLPKPHLCAYVCIVALMFFAVRQSKKKYYEGFYHIPYYHPYYSAQPRTPFILITPDDE